ncbi:cytochrome c maturation protein CcmE [Limnochorda pilosa]|uniref:cytochrome c maturation protein CcmE n=1 Tax=Limnochorda pilosa TaxID=1555112 RepID=UPI00130EB8F6|nr:cytochrome c maturation protein CcmE [Limnochorda pilosa]
MRKRWKLLVVLAAVVLVGALLASGLRGGTTYYFTVDEALAREATKPGQRFRIAGKVVPGSIDWQPNQFRLAFSVEDEGGQVPVVYQGARPDNFTDGGDVVVEGRFQGAAFQAETLLVQCPSKYEPAPEGHPTSAGTEAGERP